TYQRDDDLLKPAKSFLEDRERLLELKRCCSILNIVACEAIVYVLASLARTSFRKCYNHRHEIMANLLLDPFDMIKRHYLRVGVSSDFLRRLLRNVADKGLCFCNRRLHV